MLTNFPAEEHRNTAPHICEELLCLNMRKIELESELRSVRALEEHLLRRLDDPE